jgi:hypothetical protein
MNAYTAARREKLAEILGDEQVPMSERIDTAHDFLEQEVRSAFVRGARGSVSAADWDRFHVTQGV